LRGDGTEAPLLPAFLLRKLCEKEVEEKKAEESAFQEEDERKHPEKEGEPPEEIEAKRQKQHEEETEDLLFSKLLSLFFSLCDLSQLCLFYHKGAAFCREKERVFLFFFSFLPEAEYSIFQDELVLRTFPPGGFDLLFGNLFERFPKIGVFRLLFPLPFFSLSAFRSLSFFPCLLPVLSNDTHELLHPKILPAAFAKERIGEDDAPLGAIVDLLQYPAEKGAQGEGEVIFPLRKQREKISLFLRMVIDQGGFQEDQLFREQIFLQGEKESVQAFHEDRQLPIIQLFFAAAAVQTFQGADIVGEEDILIPEQRAEGE